ncbi:uncharacterized protein [Patagioenas fasciata]|uniref:uncharacterized protein isoform X2 n=1 Tax=Patagioenas fasciata TaxID=372321 RepID=UPI003A9A4329
MESGLYLFFLFSVCLEIRRRRRTQCKALNYKLCLYPWLWESWCVNTKGPSARDARKAKPAHLLSRQVRGSSTSRAQSSFASDCSVWCLDLVPAAAGAAEVSLMAVGVPAEHHAAPRPCCFPGVLLRSRRGSHLQVPPPDLPSCSLHFSLSVPRWRMSLVLLVAQSCSAAPRGTHSWMLKSRGSINCRPGRGSGRQNRSRNAAGSSSSARTQTPAASCRRGPMQSVLLPISQPQAARRPLGHRWS